MKFNLFISVYLFWSPVVYVLFKQLFVAWSKVKHFGPYIFFQECYSFSCYIWSIFSQWHLC